ncbi:hypothetical protein MP228_006307 [Amoeboaphelidium protococcarum]|nr:hypothetical protein MP228_006307 [Amoeboaphelidium protococcarum]
MKYQLTTAFAALIASVYGMPSEYHPESTSTFGNQYAVFQRFSSSDCSGEAQGPYKAVVAVVNQCTSLGDVSLVVSNSVDTITQFSVKTFNRVGCKAEYALDEQSGFPVVQGNYQVDQCIATAQGSSKLIAVNQHVIPKE